MGVKGKFKFAGKIIDGFNSETMEELEFLCLEIRRRENALLIQADDLMKSCAVHCGGICCRNIYTDAVINLWDCVFILASRPEMSSTIFQCLAHEDPLFTSDCVFLKNGSGPCIFPSDIRPFTCIATFCDDDAPVKQEIRSLRKGFRKLARFVTAARVKSTFSYVTSVFSRDRGI